MPPELKTIFVLAFMNPATLLAGYWLGRHSDQPQKIAVAAFMAAIAGTAFVVVTMYFGFAAWQPRLIAGVFIASMLLGALYASLGYWTRQHRDPS